MNSVLDGIFRVVQRIEAFLLASAILLIAGLTILNVVARSAFGSSIAATEELSQFLIILVTFVGLSYAASQGRHIRMTALYDQLPLRPRKALRIVITTSTAALLFLLAWYAVDYVLVVRRLGSVSPVLQVPLWLVYLAAPLGLAMAGVQYVFATARNFMSDGVYLAYHVEDIYEAEEVEHV